MITNFDNYKFRCSALGNIVTKSGKLTDGAKTYLQDCFIGEIYGVRKEAYGRALEKGIACEQDGLKMLNQTLYPETFISKIEEPIENDFIKGTPDCIPNEIVYDIKNAFDRFSFGKAELSHLYEWQVKGYCMLYELQRGRIFYCLNNMPDYMISDEERKLFYMQRMWATMDAPEYLEACDELRAAHNYNSIPVAERFKIFEVAFTTDDFLKIKNAVEQSREHLNELLKEHNDRIAFNLSLIEQAKEIAA
ncbi:MAG: hypothetical protein ACEQSL_01595 [Sediminibacterium sp.]